MFIKICDQHWPTGPSTIAIRFSVVLAVWATSFIFQVPVSEAQSIGHFPVRWTDPTTLLTIGSPPAGYTVTLIGDTSNSPRLGTRFRGDASGVRSISVLEKGDDPIEFRVGLATLCVEEPRPDGFLPCAPTIRDRTLFARQKNSGPVSGNAKSLKSVRLGSDQFATGIEVCTNNGKIKGIKLFGKTVNADGKVNHGPTSTDSFARANCGSEGRSDTVKCSYNRIIVGFHIYHSSKKGVGALTPVCGKVYVQK